MRTIVVGNNRRRGGIRLIWSPGTGTGSTPPPEQLAAADAITLTSALSDLTPEFDIDYPDSVAVTWTVVLQRSDDDFATVDAEATQTLTSVEPPTLAGTFDFGGNWATTTWKARVLFRLAGYTDSNPTTTASFTLADAVAPTLSSPLDASASSTTGTGSVSTNEANGTLYFVVSTSATPPSAAQVKLGQMHTGVAATDSGSQAVSTTGVQTITGGFTGLTASTAYYAHYMHEDAATNQSTVSSADGFTTDAGANVITLAFIGNNSDSTTTATTKTFTAQGIGTADTYRKVIVCASVFHSAGSPSISSVTCGGNAMTLVQTTGGSNLRISEIYELLVTTGTTADIIINTSSTVSRFAIAVYTITGTTAVGTVSATNVFTNSDSANSATATLTVPTGGVAISHGLNAGSAAAAADSPKTEDVDAVVGALTARFYASSISTAGSQTFTFNGGDGIFYRFLAAAWGP